MIRGFYSLTVEHIKMVATGLKQPSEGTKGQPYLSGKQLSIYAH